MGLIIPQKPWRMEDVDIIPYPREKRIEIEKEVIKEVPVERIIYKDDPGTLDLLQRTSLEKANLYLENIELKKRLSAIPVEQAPIVQPQEIIKEITKNEIVYKTIKEMDFKTTFITGFLCFLFGILVKHLIS